MTMLTFRVALGNIVGTILRRNEMTFTKTGFEPWYIFKGNQNATINSRKALIDMFGNLDKDFGINDATIVLGGREYFYAKFAQKHFDSARQIAKDCGGRVDHCKKPEYATAYCGLFSASVDKHQNSCHACKSIKKKNVAWSEETLENEIAKAAPVVEDAATMLTSFMDIAATHRDEHLAFAAKWDGYLIAFEHLHTESQASLRLLEEAQKQLDEAQLRYNVTNLRVGELLKTGDDD